MLFPSSAIPTPSSAPHEHVIIFNGPSSQQPTFINEQPALLSLIQEMKDGILVYDKNKRPLLANPTLLDLLHTTPEPVFDLCEHIFDQNELTPLIQAVFDTGKSQHTHLKWIHQNQKQYFSLSFIPLNLQENLSSNSSNQTACVCIFHDETAIRKAEKMRRDFVANVSHELRTPLSSIHGYAETLLDGAMHDETVAHDFMNTIFRHSSRLSQLVSDLLDLSKLESPDFTLDLEPLAIHPFIQSIISLAKPQADQKNLTIHFKPSPHITTLQANISTLEQVITNLLDNAIKYTPEAGTITLSTHIQPTRPNWVEVTISDTGLGIPAKHLPRLFERFYRVDKARSRDMGGTGLGLSIVKHIIQSHGGDISVASTVGEGTTFTFTLPLATDPLHSAIVNSI